MSESRVVDIFIEAAKKAVDDWDGNDTGDLLIAILLATGEDVRDELQSAVWKFDHGRYPPPSR
jgi:hypothetical protein